MEWIIGGLFALLVSYTAYRKKSLSLSGMIAATVMGTVYFGAGDVFWFGILLLFFITSSAFSKLRKERKEELERSYAKGSQRDAAQVFANGGIGMLACIGNAIWPSDEWAYFFIGTMAAVTADTWATEWGGLSKKQPRSVLSWKVIPPGTSGGVTWLGSTAALAGAAAIGGAAWLLLGWTEQSMRLGDLPDLSYWSHFAPLVNWVIIGAVSGLFGAFADSFLGATLQNMHKCKVCGKSVEVEVHCGQPTKHERGLQWLGNDMVNSLSACAAGLVAWVLGMMLFL